MKIRRYYGLSENEALTKAKNELGEDISVLTVKRIKQKGIGGLMTQSVYEVLVADNNTTSGKSSSAPNVLDHHEDHMPARVSVNIPVTPAVNSVASPAVNSIINSQIDSSVETIDAIARKVNLMEGLLERVITNFSRETDIKPQAVFGIAQKYSGAAQILYDNLIFNEVDQETAKYIIDKALSGLKPNDDNNMILSAVVEEIASLLGTPEPIMLNSQSKPIVVVFIGPTGVGKTTSLAKLAANYSLNSKKEVGLITADTYRIAAVDQLRTFSEIMGLPLAVAYSPQELKEAIASFKDKDIIMIDTAGRSHRNQAQLEEIGQLVKASNAQEIFLVMSVTTSSRNSREIISNYSFLDDYKLLFTKADESTSSGIIPNIRRITGKPLSYITNGQNVPDDIEVADVLNLANSLVETDV